MKKSIFIVVLLLISAGIFLYISEGQSIRSKKKPQQSDKNITISKIHQHTTKITQMPKVQVDEKDDREEVSMYKMISVEEAKLTTKARKNMQPVAAIQLNQSIENELVPNNTIYFSDIEGADYPIRLSEIKKNNDGSLTATGAYEDEGITYTTTITYSDNVSFITLSSSQGLYEIETSNGVGYIYRADEIRKQIKNPSPSDFILLPVPKAPPIQD